MTMVWTVLAIEMLAALGVAILATRFVYRGVARRGRSSRASVRAPRRTTWRSRRLVGTTARRAARDRVRA